jgi:heparin binding hemagglutinin HbhA
VATKEESDMTLITEIRKNVSEVTPLMAVVGATDYAVERVRAVAKDAQVARGDLEKRVQALEGRLEQRAKALEGEFEKRVQSLEKMPALVEERVRKIDPKAVQAVPALAVARTLEAAGRFEQSYEQLAVRGKELLDRVAAQQATQDLIKQGKVTLSRTRAAVTTARKAVDETTAAALAAVHLGRHEAAETVAEVAESVAATEKVVEERTKLTGAAARRTVTTARQRAVGVRSATKGVVTSARKTAEKAADAAEATAAKVGDEKQAKVADEKPAGEKHAK